MAGDRYKGVQYGLAIFYFLMAILIVILAFSLPTMTVQNGIVFMVVAVLILIASIFHMVAIPYFTVA